MLVGDSIMRNQWESLVCLVQSVIPMARKTVTYVGPTMAFHAMVSVFTCSCPIILVYFLYGQCIEVKTLVTDKSTNG